MAKLHYQTEDYVEVRDAALDQLDGEVSVRAASSVFGPVGHQAICLVKFLATRIGTFLEDQHEYGIAPDVALQHALDTVQAWLNDDWPLVEGPPAQRHLTIKGKTS